MDRLRHSSQSRVRLRNRRGFTLIEAALTTIIVGVGGVAMLGLLAAGTAANGDGAEMTTAVNLVNDMHELTLGLAFKSPTQPTHWGPEAGETLATYDDIDDLDGQTFMPAIDARRQSLTDFSNWSQSITVQSVDPNNLTYVVPNGTTKIERITVSINHSGHFVYAASWLVSTSQ
jgi:type II secretory pathway pseudopilin PulG